MSIRQTKQVICRKCRRAYDAKRHGKKIGAEYADVCPDCNYSERKKRGKEYKALKRAEVKREKAKVEAPPAPRVQNVAVQLLTPHQKALIKHIFPDWHDRPIAITEARQ